MEPTGRAGADRSTLRVLLVCLLAVPLVPPADAQDTGTADLLLRYPTQVTFTVWGDGATYNEILLEAEPEDALNATLLVRPRGRDNSLQAPETFTVNMTLVRGDNRTLLGATNGTIAPGETSDVRVTLNVTLPADLEPGAYTLHFGLATGPWDPDHANNDPPSPVPLRIGALQRGADEHTFRTAYLIGPLVFLALVAVPVTYRFVHHRPGWTRAARRTGQALDTLTARWHQAAPDLRSRLVQRAVALALLAAFLVTVIALRGLALGTRGIGDAAWIAAFALVLHLVAGTLGRARRARARLRDEGQAPGTMRLPWPDLVRATTLPALTTFLVALLAALFWQQLAAMTTFFRWPELGTLDTFAVIGVRFGAIYALVALGYTLVYGILKFINFAHGEIFMWGGYFVWMFTVGGVFGWQAPFLVAVLLGVAATGAMGAVMERVAYRPLRRASRLAPLVTAIALSVLLQGLAQFFFGASSVGFQTEGTYADSAVRGFFQTRIVILGQNVDFLAVTVLATSIVLMVALHLFIKHSRTGRAMRAVADDLDTARTIGIRVDRIISITFIIGSALAAVGGILYALRFSLRFDVGLTFGIKAFTAAVVGGIGNIHGAFLGGFLIGLAENVGAQFIDDRFQRVIAFAILVGFLLFKPRGIMPTAEEVRR